MTYKCWKLTKTSTHATNEHDSYSHISPTYTQIRSLTKPLCKQVVGVFQST